MIHFQTSKAGFAAPPLLSNPQKPAQPESVVVVSNALGLFGLCSARNSLVTDEARALCTESVCTLVQHIQSLNS